jgi:hypothetical protein
VNVSAPTGASSGSARADEMVLVGREDQFASLKALLDDVGAGGASLVIHGDPAIGKSAPVEECGRLAHARDVSVARTVGVPAEQGMAFTGRHRLLRPYLDLARASSLPELACSGRVANQSAAEDPAVFRRGPRPRCVDLRPPRLVRSRT